MARSPSESHTSPASGPVPWPRMLWAGAFTLGVCALLFPLTGEALSAGSGKPAEVVVTAVGAAAAALLLVTLFSLRQHHKAAGGAAVQQGQWANEVQWRAAERERHASESQAQYSRMHAELAEMLSHLADVQIPAALTGPAASRSLPDPVPGGNGEVSALCRRVITALHDGVAKLRDNLDDQAESSRLAVVMLARRVQASAHRIQEEASRMADRHPGDPDVLESSMRVDHAAAQQARHAQSVAVLCGEWPGQQWPEPLALVDVVRAASSRIVAYQRVAVSGEPDIAASADIVEPLIHLIAELLANATQSSPPTTQVLVTVRTVQRGAVVEIDDGGIGMEEHRLGQAKDIVSGQRLLRLGDLGDVPQTGMAVVGQYVHRHGFRVDLMPSPYGGVRAVVLVPSDMVTNLEPGAMTLALTAAGPAAEPALTAPASTHSPAEAGTASLPRRRSRRGEPGPGNPVSPSHAGPDLSTQTPEQAGEWMAAYLLGSAGEAAAPGGPAPAAPGTDPPGSGTDSLPGQQA